MARRWKFVAVAGAAVVLLAGCNKVTRVTNSGYQDSVRCLSQSMSGDGKYVAFSTMGDPAGIRTDQQTVLRNVETGSSRQIAGMFSGVEVGGGMSTNGQRIALVVAPLTGSRKGQATIWDKATGKRTRLNPASEDVVSIAISGDGKKAVYDVDGGDLWVQDIASGSRTAVAVPAGANAGSLFAARLSGTGRYITFRVNDGVGHTGTYTRDLSTGTTTALVSGSAEAGSSTGAASISADGRYVAFDKILPGSLSHAQVYVWDRVANTTAKLTSTTGSEYSGSPSISGDGKRVAFVTSKVPERISKVMVWDRTTGKTTTAVTANEYVHDPVASTDGHEVAFCTSATNLVSGSPNAPNVYVWSGT